MAREVDGMSITNVFTPDEVARALEHFERMKPQATPQTFGAMLGMPLNQPGADTTDLTPHLDDADLCRELYTEAFGFDPHERVAGVFAALTELGFAHAPSVYGRACNQANVRWYEPNRGGLRTHAGEEILHVVPRHVFHRALRIAIRGRPGTSDGGPEGL